MALEWADAAYKVAADAAKTPFRRRRGPAQRRWDREHMFTESTRFTETQDRKLTQYCEEADVSKYRLIDCLLRAWMAAWEEYHHERE